MMHNTNRFIPTAAALFHINDRVCMRSGFYEGEEGIIIGSGLTLRVKLDNVPQALTVGWNQIDNLTLPLHPFKYNKNR